MFSDLPLEKDFLQIDLLRLRINRGNFSNTVFLFTYIYKLAEKEVTL
jgi:hypothetical protein